MKKITLFGEEVNFLPFTLILLLILVFIGGCSYRVFWLKSVDNYEYAYRWNRLDGSITRINHTGWCTVEPFVTKIYTVDSRPVQIRIEASSNVGGINNRVLNAKLVQFDPKGADQFFAFHGLNDYSLSDLSEILKVYAYEDWGTNNYNADSLEKKYKFLKILSRTSGVDSKMSKSVTDTTIH